MTRALLFLFSFLLTIDCTAQQPPRFLHYTVKNGLSQNSVHAIFRDRDGLMWIGTQDGLNSFNGKNFIIYRHDEKDTTTISDQFVLQIKEDKDGFLWIGTRNGINRFNKQTGKFSRYYISDSEKHIFQSDYNDFFLQEDGNVVVSRKHSVYIINPKLNTVTGIKAPGNFISSWYISSDYKVWLINKHNQIYTSRDIRNGLFEFAGLSPYNDISTFENTEINVSGDSIIFIYNKETATKLFSYLVRNKKWKVPLTLPAPVIHLSAASGEVINIATTKGILRINKKGIANIIKNDPRNNNSLPPGNILATYTDVEGNLWVGTAGNGFAVNNLSFENYLIIKSPVTNDVITSVARSGLKIFAGSRSGLYVIKNYNDAFLQKEFIPVLTGISVTALTVDHFQNVWAAIQGEGIIVINNQGSVIKKFTTKNSLLHNAGIMHLATDSRGRILISSAYYFFIVPSLSEKWIKFSAESPGNKIEGNYVLSSFEDREGNIWICNNAG
ncbi:MAG: two-component regulator propeller domain-containing protein [Ferruginibacter sp.]